MMQKLDNALDVLLDLGKLSIQLQDNVPVLTNILYLQKEDAWAVGNKIITSSLSIKCVNLVLQECQLAILIILVFVLKVNITLDNKRNVSAQA